MLPSWLRRAMVMSTAMPGQFSAMCASVIMRSSIWPLGGDEVRRREDVSAQAINHCAIGGADGDHVVIDRDVAMRDESAALDHVEKFG